MSNPKQITTLTQLGARLAVARLHIRRLEASCPNARVNHVLYIVDPQNFALQEFARSLDGAYTVYDREDNDWTDFSRRTAPTFGGDLNYDFLIRRPEVGDIFLTLHDDTLIEDTDVWRRVRTLASEYHFGGYLDTRNIPGYARIKLDGIPMTDLRIGTWFCFGRRAHYLQRGYTIGDYRNYFVWQLYRKYPTLRLRVRGVRFWLNGGFDLNIRARLSGDRFYTFDKQAPYAVHWNKVTGFFAKRGLLQFADTPEEVERWRDYLAALVERDRRQFEFDVSFLGRLTNELAVHGITDHLLNRERLAEFRELGA